MTERSNPTGALGLPVAPRPDGISPPTKRSRFPGASTVTGVTEGCGRIKQR